MHVCSEHHLSHSRSSCATQVGGPQPWHQNREQHHGLHQKLHGPAGGGVTGEGGGDGGVGGGNGGVGGGVGGGGDGLGGKLG